MWSRVGVGKPPMEHELRIHYGLTSKLHITKPSMRPLLLTYPWLET